MRQVVQQGTTSAEAARDEAAITKRTMRKQWHQQPQQPFAFICPKVQWRLPLPSRSAQPFTAVQLDSPPPSPPPVPELHHRLSRRTDADDDDDDDDFNAIVRLNHES
jgi:hypothetical protein